MTSTDKEVLRVWHERNHCGKRTGRTIAVLWRGEQRFVGVAACGKKDQFSKATGWKIAVSRARGAIGLKDPFAYYPKLFSCAIETFKGNVAVALEFPGLPKHLYLEERQDADHAQAIRSESA